MIPSFSREQIVERYDTLPEVLQNAFFLPANSEEAIRICKLNHITDDKIARVTRVGVYVLLGYIDVDDFAKEIQEYVPLPPEIAGIVAREFRRKIFSLYEKDIAKIYAPLGGTTQETRKTREEALPVISQKESGAPATLRAPSSMPREAGRFPAPMPLPRAMEKVEPIPQGIAPAGAVPRDEPAKPMPAPATPPLSHAPFILHKEETIKATSGTKPIDLSFSMPETKKAGSMPLIAAELELGKEEEKRKKEPVIAKTAEPSQRIVHYSDFRTPINPFEGKPNPPTNIVPRAPQPAPAPASASPTPMRIPTIPTPTSGSPAPQPVAVPIASTPPMPIPQTAKPTPIVKAEGNVIDLRQNKQ